MEMKKLTIQTVDDLWHGKFIMENLDSNEMFVQFNDLVTSATRINTIISLVSLV